MNIQDEVWKEMMGLWALMEKSRPKDRGEEARRWAVAITEYQKAMAYFSTFVIANTSLAPTESPSGSD